MQKMKILVTGGKGFIGSHLVDKLLKLGHEVTAFDKSTRTVSYQGWKKVKYIYGATENVKLLDGAIAANDYIIHLAGILGTSETLDDIYKTIDANILGTINVLESLRKYNKPGLNITIGGINWLNPYAITKLAAEKFSLMYAKEFDLDIKVIRGLNTYGSRQKHAPVKKAVPNFIINALQDKQIEIYGNGKQIVDLVYVEDLVKVMIRAMNYKGKILHVIDAGTGKKVTVNELAQMIIRLTNSKSKIKYLPMRKGEPLNSITLADTETLKELGFIPSISLEDGMKKTIEWYRAQL
jgi:UDP-glucose 4-epimerase